MGTPALSREKSDLARRSVAMIAKEAVGSPKVPNQLQTPQNSSACQFGSIVPLLGSWACCVSHVNKRGILGIQDSRHLGLLAGTFWKLTVFYIDWTQMLYMCLPATISVWQTAFQIFELSLPAIHGRLICMAALYKVPARPSFRWYLFLLTCEN